MSTAEEKVILGPEVWSLIAQGIVSDDQIQAMILRFNLEGNPSEKWCEIGNEMFLVACKQNGVRITVHHESRCFETA